MIEVLPIYLQRALVYTYNMCELCLCVTERGRESVIY